MTTVQLHTRIPPKCSSAFRNVALFLNSHDAPRTHCLKASPPSPKKMRLFSDMTTAQLHIPTAKMQRCFPKRGAVFEPARRTAHAVPESIASFAKKVRLFSDMTTSQLHVPIAEVQLRFPERGTVFEPARRAAHAVPESVAPPFRKNAAFLQHDNATVARTHSRNAAALSGTRRCF